MATTRVTVPGWRGMAGMIVSDSTIELAGPNPETGTMSLTLIVPGYGSMCAFLTPDARAAIARAVTDPVPVMEAVEVDRCIQ